MKCFEIIKKVKLEEAIQKIQKLSIFTFNKEQKALAIRMLKQAPQPEIKVWYDFIIQRVKLGFTFDTTTIPNYGQIALLREQKKLNLINKKLSNAVEHKLIIGENYDVLKNLLLTHRNQIDIIYIDPPYNTEAAHSEGNTRTTQKGDYKSHFESNESVKAVEEKIKNTRSKLNYRDKFSRTGWLNIMKERLELAKNLLTNVGVIFVSIDDSEQAYLKVLMDEIFGENNFICNFIWEKTNSIKNNSDFISENHDYILCYRKSSDLKKFNGLSRTTKNNKVYKYEDEDGRGPYQSIRLTVKDGRKYDVVINGITYSPGENGWGPTEEKMQKLIRENRIIIPKNKSRLLRLKGYLSEAKPIISKTIISDYALVGRNDENKRLLNKEIFKDKKERQFYFPKGTKLIKYLIKLVPNNENATILDFFAGSGTTGHAVMELNRKDQGKRQFILITNNENKIAENITYERLHRIIKGYGTDGENDFKWLQKNQPFENNNLRVFGLKYRDVSFRTNLDNLEAEAIQELQKLNPHFSNADDIDIYYQLATLYPQNNSNGTN